MQNSIAEYHIEKCAAKPTSFNFTQIHPSWHDCIKEALNFLPADYREKLLTSDQWLPGSQKIFNAFSLPVEKVNYVLFGESPYPRAHSANGYAFWDAAVDAIWSPTGLSKAVNRATSLRNIIKMLLIAEGHLTAEHCTQTDIAAINKEGLIQTNHQLFTNLLQHGFLLLNASLVLQPSHVRKDARIWRGFLAHVMQFLLTSRPSIELVLLGNIANEIDPLITAPGIRKFYAEHPYNISFIHNPTVIKFFQPLHLLKIQ